ncbi:MAG: glucose-fructose oxidoreductase [Dyadobacter sp. 50-39]|uniref:Gfo/Idh/MocA family protein n=1 Tax=Dyadobacter sp. 50-39 TaxID=1895756 RepID=UPI0009643386|nr:Gfo/Idh/MocA family oxidoreductase [Dyadobacter sp. 50-39]OJV19256.1 MAG: glucose-fructose oxidoreductase [Dyadobacter sp. 50-39]
METKTKLGIALAGLGKYATEQLIPALRLTKHCQLAGLVSSDDEKKQKWKQECGLKEDSLYGYDDFDRIADNPDIDIVYIVLPNAMHAEYCIRAARAGKHIICEKPLAMNVEECYRIREAVSEAQVRFSMGYRLHFDPFNREMMRLGQDEVFGPVRKMELLDSMDIGTESPWRIDRERAGGGPLLNNGIYCIQAALYIKGKLPVAVEARFAPVTNPGLFKEVEEGLIWTMFFEDGATAQCETSYSKNQNLMRAEGTEGWFELNPGYEYGGLTGRTSSGSMDLKPVNQQALQMDDFAHCIMTDGETRVPIEMGIRDMKIAEAIYAAAKSGERVALHLEEFGGLPEF